MVGTARGSTLVAPLRRNVSPGRVAPEWRPLWRDLAWMFAPALAGGGTLYDLVSRTSLAPTNGAFSTGSPYGRALELDGDDDYVELGSVDPTHPVSGHGVPMTVRAIWRLDTVSGGDDYKRLIDKSDGGAGASGWSLQVDHSGLMNLTSDGGTGNFSTSAGLFSAGTWYETVWEFNDVLSTPRCWVDGVEVTISGGGDVSLSSDTTNARIGTWNHSTGREWDGRIALIQIWHRHLGEGEIARLHGDPLGMLRPWRPLATAAGPTTHQLSGTLAAAFALDGAIEVGRGLGGAFATSLTLGGTLAVEEEGLEGALVTALTLGGALDARRGLAGTWPLSVLLGGALGGPSPTGDALVADAPVGTASATSAALGSVAIGDTARGDLEVSDG